MEKNVTNNKNGTLILVGVAMLLLFSLALSGNLILPDFHEIFINFETDLPLSTSIVMSSYKGWWIFPIIASWIFVDLLRRGDDVTLDYIKKVKTIGVVGILMAIFVSIFSIYAVYAPVLEST